MRGLADAATDRKLAVWALEHAWLLAGGDLADLYRLSPGLAAMRRSLDAPQRDQQ